MNRLFIGILLIFTLSYNPVKADNGRQKIAVVSGNVKNGQASVTSSQQGVLKAYSEGQSAANVRKKPAVLYDQKLDNARPRPEFSLNGVATFTDQGLKVTGTDSVVQLNKFYAIAERKVQYKVRFSPDAKAVFRSSLGDFSAFVDVPNKTISMATYPATEKKVDFLKGDHEYLIEVFHIYQKAIVRITDIQSGDTLSIQAVNDGPGGAGKGKLQEPFSVGMQWDYYCFGLLGGTSMNVESVSVYALKRKVKLLMYGDSITQPEGYFPSENFPYSWTQQIISHLHGNAMSSGRGGAQIDMVLKFIRNELPYIKTKYVMVTIGTNGGNTEAKLKELVNYIRSQGAIPILNNIPSNESGKQVAENKLIQKVREELGIKGCHFDRATSLDGDGRKVDQSTMFWEDYTGSYGWQIYHHPNKVGGVKMYQQTLIDLPELYQ